MVEVVTNGPEEMLKLLEGGNVDVLRSLVEQVAAVLMDAEAAAR